MALAIVHQDLRVIDDFHLRELLLGVYKSEYHCKHTTCDEKSYHVVVLSHLVSASLVALEHCCLSFGSC